MPDGYGHTTSKINEIKEIKLKGVTLVPENGHIIVGSIDISISPQQVVIGDRLCELNGQVVTGTTPFETVRRLILDAPSGTSSSFKFTSTVVPEFRKKSSAASSSVVLPRHCGNCGNEYFSGDVLTQ